MTKYLCFFSSDGHYNIIIDTVVAMATTLQEAVLARAIDHAGSRPLPQAAAVPASERVGRGRGQGPDAVSQNGGIFNTVVERAKEGHMSGKEG